MNQLSSNSTLMCFPQILENIFFFSISWHLLLKKKQSRNKVEKKHTHTSVKLATFCASKRCRCANHFMRLFFGVPWTLSFFTMCFHLYSYLFCTIPWGGSPQSNAYLWAKPKVSVFKNGQFRDPFFLRKIFFFWKNEKNISPF
jgi:hypothetical protein